VCVNRLFHLRPEAAGAKRKYCVDQSANGLYKDSGDEAFIESSYGNAGDIWETPNFNQLIHNAREAFLSSLSLKVIDSWLCSSCFVLLTACHRTQLSPGP
jgi:hypothetical protein